MLMALPFNLFNLLTMFFAIIAKDISLFLMSLMSILKIILRITLSSFISGIFGVGLGYIDFLPEEIKTDDNYRIDLRQILYLKNWKKLYLSVAAGVLVFSVIFSPIVLVYGLLSVCQSIIPITNLEFAYQRLKARAFLKSFFSAFFAIFLSIVGYYVFIFFNPNKTQHQGIVIIGLIYLSYCFFFLAFFFTPIYRHIILRFCLYFEGSTPLKYATFLDLATEARILEKDGGHWRFRHQTLQEHFAKQYDTL
jgi:hypothetical protein